jgi:hypothetical protein
MFEPANLVDGGAIWSSDLQSSFPARVRKIFVCVFPCFVANFRAQKKSDEIQESPECDFTHVLKQKSSGLKANGISN